MWEMTFYSWRCLKIIVSCCFYPHVWELRCEGGRCCRVGSWACLWGFFLVFFPFSKNISKKWWVPNDIAVCKPVMKLFSCAALRGWVLIIACLSPVLNSTTGRWMGRGQMGRWWLSHRSLEEIFPGNCFAEFFPWIAMMEDSCVRSCVLPVIMGSSFCHGEP